MGQDIDQSQRLLTNPQKVAPLVHFQDDFPRCNGGEVRNVGEEHGNLAKEKGGDLVNIAAELEKTGT